MIKKKKIGQCVLLTAFHDTFVVQLSLGKNHLARHSERGKKTRQIEEEVGRQHQGMDRSEVRQIPELSLIHI